MPTAQQVKSQNSRNKAITLSASEFTSGGAKVYDYDTARDQVYTVTLSERVEPVNPDNPTPQQTHQSIQDNQIAHVGQLVSMIWITRKVLAVLSITFTKMEARLRMMWLKL